MASCKNMNFSSGFYKKSYKNKKKDEVIKVGKRDDFEEQLKCGYQEMSQINLTLAEFGYSEDYDELCVYECNLVGCD